MLFVLCHVLGQHQGMHSYRNPFNRNSFVSIQWNEWTVEKNHLASISEPLLCRGMTAVLPGQAVPSIPSCQNEKNCFQRLFALGQLLPNTVKTHTKYVFYINCKYIPTSFRFPYPAMSGPRGIASAASFDAIAHVYYTPFHGYSLRNI